MLFSGAVSFCVWVWACENCGWQFKVCAVGVLACVACWLVWCGSCFMLFVDSGSYYYCFVGAVRSGRYGGLWGYAVGEVRAFAA